VTCSSKLNYITNLLRYTDADLPVNWGTLKPRYAYAALYFIFVNFSQNSGYTARLIVYPMWPGFSR